MLRAHAEQRWLSREVIPVLRQLEALDELPEEQYGAAYAYLEVIWTEAQQRARETDSARAAVQEKASEDSALPRKACRYYGSIRLLREVVTRRVSLMLAEQTALATQAPAQS